MRLFSSLQSALKIHFVATAMIPLLVFGLLISIYVENQQVKELQNNLYSHVLGIKHQTTSFMAEVQSDLELVAKTLQQELLQGPLDTNQYLQLTVQNSRFFESIYVVDQNYRIVSLGLHQQLAQTVDDYLGLDLSAHAVFANPQSGDAPVWSDSFISLLTGQPSVSLLVPVDRQHILFGTLSLEWLSDFLASNIWASPEASFAVVDQNGTLVAHSQPELALQRVNLFDHPEVKASLKSRTELFQKYHEDPRLLESLSVIPDVGWVVYASLPSSVATATVAKVRWLLLGILSITLILAYMIANWFSLRLGRPLIGLQKLSRDLAHGTYDPLQLVSGYREIDDLAHSFQQMSDAIHERELSLRKSEARFRELVESIDAIVWELNIDDFKFTYISQQAEQILGYPIDRWLLEDGFWQQHMHPDDRDWAEQYCLVQTNAKQDHEFEYRMITADGLVVWLKDVVTVVIENDRPVQLRGVMIDITARKKAEMQMLEARDRLQLLIERMPLACIVWDADFQVEIWNPAAERIFGYPSREVVGETMFSRLMPKHLKAKVDEIWRRLISGESMTHTITENLTCEGNVIICEWFNTPLRDESGRVIGALSMVQDVTMREQAEQALRDSEERFRSVFQASPDPIVITRLTDAKIVDVNDQMVAVSGYTRDQLLGFDTSKIGIWVDLDERRKFFEKVYHEHRIDDFEALVRLADGLVRVATISGRTVLLGSERCLLVVVHDVTEFKRVEEGLRTSEMHLRHLTQQFEALLQAIPDRIVVYDQDLKVSWINRHGPQADGAFNQDVVGSYCHEIVGIQCAHHGPAGSGPDEGCLVRRCLASGQTEEEQVTTSSGRVLSNRAFPIKETSGNQIINVIEISQDITETVQLQEHNLRTSQLAALGELAAGVAHEINNPINGIINYAQLLLNQFTESDRQAEISRRIIREGDRIATIVRELLYFARDGGQETHLVEVDKALKEALTLTETQLYKEGIDLQIEMPEGLPNIESYSHQVQQLFLNLISNARHALNEKYPDVSPDKILRITAEVMRREKKPYVRIRFRDHGIGIPQDLLPRILNPFVTTKPSGVGTGLGLSICHEIVQRHKGFIQIDSEYGHYTAVTVDLPVKL